MPKTKPPLNDETVAKALGLHSLAVLALRSGGVLDRCVAESGNGGGPVYTSFALPLVALADDLAGAVQAGQLTQNQAGCALVDLTELAFKAWDRYLRTGLVLPLQHSGLTLRSVTRAAKAYRR